MVMIHTVMEKQAPRQIQIQKILFFFFSSPSALFLSLLFKADMLEIQMGL